MEMEEGERRITARRDSLKYITSQKGNTERQQKNCISAILLPTGNLSTLMHLFNNYLHH